MSLIALCMGLVVGVDAFAESQFPGEPSLWFNDDTSAPAVSLYFFWSNRCQHCLVARPFIESLEDRFPWLRLHSYEIYVEPENRLRFN